MRYISLPFLVWSSESMRMNQQQTDSLHIVVWCGIILIRILSEFQPRRGSDIAVKNCHNLSHRRMVQELLTSNDKVAQFHHQGGIGARRLCIGARIGARSSLYRRILLKIWGHHELGLELFSDSYLTLTLPVNERTKMKLEIYLSEAWMCSELDQIWPQPGM